MIGINTKICQNASRNQNVMAVERRGQHERDGERRLAADPVRD